MEENQKNKENKQEVSEMKNNPQEGEIKRYLASFPPGYRFDPTDEELIIHYLKPKNLGQPLPPNKIKEVNLYEYSPQQLYDKYKEKEMYFFTSRDRKYPQGNRPSRSAGNGYWFTRSGEKPIGNKDQPIGYKTNLAFREGTTTQSTKTDWIMDEFTIDQTTAPSESKVQQTKKMDGWVLCRVYYSSCRVYGNSAKEETNPGQSDLESPLPVGSPPPGLDHVNSQRPAHPRESSFPKPQVDQNSLVSVRPHPKRVWSLSSLGHLVPMPRSNQDLHSTRPPLSEMSNTHSGMPGNSRQTGLREPHQPGFQNVNSQMAAHDTGESYCPMPGGYRDSMPRSHQDLLSTRPLPSEFSNTHSWMPGNSGQTRLRKPHQPGFQNVNSQMAAHNTGESYYPKPGISAHTGGYRVPMPCSNHGLLSTRPPTSQMYNTPSWMPGDSGQTFMPNPEQPGFQDPLLLNNAHPSGMYNTYPHMPHMPQFQLLHPTNPHFAEMFNPYAQMYDNTGHNSFPMPQTYQDHPYSKRPRFPDMHNIGYNENFLFQEPQPNKDFMPPTRPGTYYTDSQSYVQRNCYPEYSFPLPNREHDSNEFPSFVHHNNVPEEDEEFSSELARDKPSQHGLQQKDDKHLGS